MTTTAAPGEDEEPDNLPAKPKAKRPDDYQRHRRRQAAAAKEQSTEARDIGPIPKVVNPKRRESCRLDLKKYLLTYFRDSFPKPFSDDHLRILADIQQRALEGGLKAIAMPRGSGKTTILLRAMQWVLCYGHRRFGVLVEADEGAAVESMDAIKVEWETNALLLEDFPEIAYPIRCLEGITQRGNAQTTSGARTLIGWKRKELVFPTIAGSVASGATIRCTGILGRVRGMQRVTSDGKTLRPDFVLVNDPQTDASAMSELENAKREKIIGGALLGLAGPGSRIAGFAAVTVIREGDVADRMLNPKLMPKWHGDRCRLVYDWPTDTDHWKKYFDIRSEEIAEGNDEHPKATKYYRAHRAAMDAGSRAGWPARKFDHELSAIQHAMDLRFDNPDTFDAEYQNQPRTATITADGIKCLSSDEFCLRVLDTHRRGEVPDWVEHITLGIDVQETSLWWVVSGIGGDFTGMVLDYGIWPDPGIDYVTLRDIDRTIIRATGIKSSTEALLAAANRLYAERLATEYTRDDGTVLRLSHTVIDAGYKSEVIYRFAQSHSHVTPSHGKGVTARSRPWSMEKRKAGERIGYGWRLPPTRGVRAPRYCLVDTNTWKTTMMESWAMEAGAPGAWYLYRAAPQRHRLFGDNCSAEYPTKTAGHGRELYEWAVRPNRDNHLWDALLLSAVAGSIQGIKVPGESERVISRRRVRMSARVGSDSEDKPSSSAAPITDVADRRVEAATQMASSGERRTLAQMRAARRG
jgi:hypothetical protein